MKENLRSENEKQEIMRLSSIKSSTLKKIKWKTVKNYWTFYVIKKFNLFLCVYKSVGISAETWNKAEVSVIKIHENNNVNETVLLLICISDAKKRWGGKNLTWLIKKLKENME